MLYNAGQYDDLDLICSTNRGLRNEEKVVNIGHATTWLSDWKKDERLQCISNYPGIEPFVVHSSSCGLEHADALTYYAPDLRKFYYATIGYAQVTLSPWANPKDKIAMLITEESVYSNGFIGTPQTRKMEKNWWSTFFGYAEEDLRKQFNILQSFDLRPSESGFPRFPRNFGLANLWPLMRTKKRQDLTLKRGPTSGFGLVVWAAANCAAVSGRLEYLKEINTHVRVDSIGRCWPTFEPQVPDDRVAQWVWMGNVYKFWYAAENYICDSYISEKMFIPLAYGSVPIIYGSKMHHKFAPSSDSYIDVRDYPSAAALAAHLVYLDSNHTAYAAYHAWRTRPLEELNPNFVDLLDRAGLLSFNNSAAMCELGRLVLAERQGASSKRAHQSLLEGKVGVVSCVDPEGTDIPIRSD